MLVVNGFLVHSSIISGSNRKTKTLTTLQTMTLTKKQKDFIKTQHPNYIVNGEFAGEDNDFSCLVSRFAMTITNAGYPGTAAQLSLDLQPAGFIHGTLEEVTAQFVKMSKFYL